MHLLSKTAQRLLALLAIAAVLVACATNIDSLAPFPCATDGTCPDGFGCDQQKLECYQCTNGVTSGKACSGSCVDLASDSNNCGACGATCGNAACVTGSCMCVSGTLCGTGITASCVDLATDTSNCGKCGNGCPSAETCVRAVCSCTTGTFCSAEDRCTDLATDASNCGKCGNACPGNEVCSGGTCGCPAGDRLCGASTCANLATDNSNCGACGNVCPGTETCQTGMCGCTSPETVCGVDICTNLTNDTNNCGTCGNACPATQVCVAGECGCAAGMDPCPVGGTMCTSLETDPMNCGTCGTLCTNGQTCQASTCMCPPAPGGGACDVFPQCGCSPGSTQCERDTSAPEACIPIGGTPAGGACTSSTSCASGTACYAGICAPFCDAATPCASATSVCIPVQQTDGTLQGFSVCLGHCNPVSPYTATATDVACPPNQTCLLFSAGTVTGTACIPVTTEGQSGASCTESADCSPGLDCTSYASEMSGTCEAYCFLSAGCPPSVGDGYSCIPFSTTLMVDGETVGYCGAPCNPASPEEPLSGQVACLAGDTCSYVSANGNASTQCLAITAENGPGSPCSGPDECEAGYECYIATGSTTGSCVEWCTNVGGECPNATACETSVTLAGHAYGLCGGAP